MTVSEAHRIDGQDKSLGYSNWDAVQFNWLSDSIGYSNDVHHDEGAKHDQ
jgi:hypothetical protein